MKSHTVETLFNILNELIKQGYNDYEVRVTYDGGHGAVGIADGVNPHIKESLTMGEYVLFSEDDERVRGFL